MKELWANLLLTFIWNFVLSAGVVLVLLWRPVMIALTLGFVLSAGVVLVLVIGKCLLALADKIFRRISFWIFWISF